MTPLIPLFLSVVVTAPDDGIHDIRSLVAAIEAAQRPIEDFRCEFEGKLVSKGPLAELQRKKRLDLDGLPTLAAGDDVVDEKGGVFIWTKRGDMHVDDYRRSGGYGYVSWNNNIIRALDRKIDQRSLPFGGGILNTSTSDVDGKKAAGFAKFFRIDTLRSIRDDENRETFVTDDVIDGRPMKLVTVNFVFLNTNLPNRLVLRYWVDLQRNGHVVRIKEYLSDGQTDITLKPFKVGKEEVWIPVAETTEGKHMEDAKGVPITASETTLVRTEAIIESTLQFNTRPGPEVFSTRYRLPAPVSENLRSLKRDFDAKKNVPRPPTKAGIADSIQKQLSRVDAQGGGLVAGSPDEGFAWWTLSVWGLGAAGAASLAALWIQRRAG
jgi:hypothetical protein